MFCLEPEETIEFFKTEEKPWIAFKTLAAGAITPKSGFKYAFENGADFITVGMFDFQIAEDTAAVREVLEKTTAKTAPVAQLKIFNAIVFCRSCRRFSF